MCLVVSSNSLPKVSAALSVAIPPQTLQIRLLRAEAELQMCWFGCRGVFVRLLFVIRGSTIFSNVSRINEFSSNRGPWCYLVYLYSEVYLYFAALDGKQCRFFYVVCPQFLQFSTFSLCFGIPEPIELFSEIEFQSKQNMSILTDLFQYVIVNISFT